MYAFTKSKKTSQDIKKVCSLRNAIVKKDMKSRWWPRNDCDDRLMAKLLIMTIEVYLGPCMKKATQICYVLIWNVHNLVEMILLKLTS